MNISFTAKTQLLTTWIDKTTGAFKHKVGLKSWSFVRPCRFEKNVILVLNTLKQTQVQTVALHPQEFDSPQLFLPLFLVVLLCKAITDWSMGGITYFAQCIDVTGH